MMTDRTLVEYFNDHEGYKCGYCKNKTTSFNRGMWAHSLECPDYQGLINRGWRRSGQYCYKPSMDVTCCPLYGIRCHAESFRPSKSQKKVIRRMRNFLISGGQKDIDEWKAVCETKHSHDPPNHDSDDEEIKPDAPKEMANSEDVAPREEKCITPDKDVQAKRKEPRKGDGADPSKPKAKKAKQMRLERKMKKIQEKGEQSADLMKPKKHKGKTLEEMLPHLNLPENAKHKLELRLIPCRRESDDFNKTRKESYEIYKKYQVAIHKDHPGECNDRQWSRFLVESPLINDDNLFKPGFGSYHNQYWLDDKLIAVGVMDILPNYVSSVYLYYDPDYGFLSLGVYSALSEIVMTRGFHALCPSITHYCMGYFIQNCPKMRYKSKFRGSEILCPETYTWVPIQKCIPTLDKQKYARLNVLNGGSPDATDEDGTWENLDEVMCFYRRRPYNYKDYQEHKYIERRKDDLCPPTAEVVASRKEREHVRVRQYASMIGKKCAKTILLFRSEADDYY